MPERSVGAFPRGMGALSRNPLESADRTGQMSRQRQRIRFLRTSDGVQLAWAQVGTGPTLIKTSNWIIHLEYVWVRPVLSQWIRFFIDHFLFIRYDERGCGMSDWYDRELSVSGWVDD